MKYVDKDKNIHIEAADLKIGNNVRFGKDIKITVRGTFQIGDNSNQHQQVCLDLGSY